MTVQRAQKYGIGFVLYKSFQGSRYRGVIESFDSNEGFYKIKYNDGDEEELDERNIDVLLRQKAKLLPPIPPPTPIPPMSWSKGQMLHSLVSFEHPEVPPMPLSKGHPKALPQYRPQQPSNFGPVKTSHFPISSRPLPARIPSTLHKAVSNRHSNISSELVKTSFPCVERSAAPSPQKLSAAEKRNQQRYLQRNHDDQQLSGKFLPTNIAFIFGSDLSLDDDDRNTPPSWLLDEVSRVAATPQDPPPAGPFKYSPDTASVQLNSKNLEDHDFDLELVLEKFQHTSLNYGNEFRPIEDMEKIYGNHDLFSFFKQVHQHGMEYKYTRELNPDEKMVELEAQLIKGNHKGATTQEEELKKKLFRDVQYGFSVPVLASILKKIKGAMLQPCNLAAQFSLTETGERVLKKRLTHDMSDGITQEDVSVNSRSDLLQYPPMVYGWALIRIIIYIVALRLAHPNKRILISKYDLSDAYRRIANGFKAAAETILLAGQIAFIMLRLCFGASVNPPTWCSFSEMVTDLSNELPLIKDWNPDELHHPMQPKVPDPEYAEESIPLAAAKEMAINVPTTALGRGDCFIDDIIKVFLDTKEAIRRHASSALLAIFVSIRPFAGERETVPRKEVVSFEKWKAEGVPRERQIVLGWMIDTRLSLLCLPTDKYKAYVQDIDNVLNNSGRLNLKELESIIGKLQHSAYVIPLAGHFLSGLRRRVSKMRKAFGFQFWSNFRSFRLSKEDLADLALWKDLLYQA